MSRERPSQHGQAPASAAGANSSSGGDLEQAHAAVQILEGGGLFPRITAWAAGAIEQGNFAGASEASRRWFISRPYLRTLARSLDPSDRTVIKAQALLDDMAPFEERLPTVLEMTLGGDGQSGRAAWLARIGHAPKGESGEAGKAPAASGPPPVQSPLRPENAKSGWDYVTGVLLGPAVLLYGETHRGTADPLADMINNAVDSSAYSKGFAVGGVEGAWDALKDNARVFADINDLIVDLVKAKIAGGDLGVLYAVRDKIKGLIAAGKQVPAALKAFAERWNDASDLAAQGHFQGHAVGYIAVQVLALVIGAVTPGGQYADVINILKLATDPLGGLLELGTAARAARAAKTAGKVEHAAEGAVAGERAGVKAAEGAAGGERTLGGVFEEAGGAGRPPGESARPGATTRDGAPARAGQGAADVSTGGAPRVGDESAAHDVGRPSPALEGIARPLSRSEALLGGLPADLRGRVRIVESPVLTDSTVRVAYRDGIELVVGAAATARHVAYHARTVRVLLRFEGLVGEIRKLIDKVLTRLRVRAGYGTRGFEAELEVQKLTGIRDDLQRLLARTDDRLQGGDALDPDLLRAELESVEAQLAEHRTSLGSFENGRGVVAAEGGDSAASKPFSGSPEASAADDAQGGLAATPHAEDASAFAPLFRTPLASRRNRTAGWTRYATVSIARRPGMSLTASSNEAAPRRRGARSTACRRASRGSKVACLLLARHGRVRLRRDLRLVLRSPSWESCVRGSTLLPPRLSSTSPRATHPRGQDDGLTSSGARPGSSASLSMVAWLPRRRAQRVSETMSTDIQIR